MYPYYRLNITEAVGFLSLPLVGAAGTDEALPLVGQLMSSSVCPFSCYIVCLKVGKNN
jgi:hypothetical protein